MTAPIVSFAADVLGFPLKAAQAEIVNEIYSERVRIAILRLGRRSGKDRLASVVATYESTANAGVHLARVPAGEQVGIVVVAPSQKLATRTHNYIASYFARPALRDLVKRQTMTEIELKNGMLIQVLPGHSVSVRGLAVAVVILTEAAHFTGRDGSPLDVAELWAAIVPGTLDFPQAKVMVLSTPRWSTDWFASISEKAEKGSLPNTRAWHRSTGEMRAGEPDVEAFLALERMRDPLSFDREYLATFDSTVGGVFDSETVRAAVRDGGDLAPRPGISYLISLDPAFVRDTFAMVIGHKGEINAADLVVVDRVLGRRGSKAHPVMVDQVLDEVADLSLAYGHASVICDQFAAQPVVQGLRARGVSIRERPWTAESKVAAATSTRRALHAQRLSLPAHEALIAELQTLEQRPLPSGRTHIEAAGGARDDYAMSLLALVDELDAGGREARSRSTLPETGGPVVRRGELIFRGERYVDKPTPNYPWRP